MTIETIHLISMLGGILTEEKLKKFGIEEDRVESIRHFKPYSEKNGIDYTEVIDDCLRKYIEKSISDTNSDKECDILYNYSDYIDKQYNEFTNNGLEMIRRNEKRLNRIYDSLYPSFRKRMISKDFYDVKIMKQMRELVKRKEQIENYSLKVFNSPEKIKDLLDFYYNKINIDPVKTSIIENNPCPIRDYCISHIDKIEEMSVSEIGVFAHFIRPNEIEYLGDNIGDLFYKLKNRFKDFEFDNSLDFFNNVKLESKGKNFTIKNDNVEEYKEIYENLKKVISSEEKYREILLKRYPILSSYPTRQKSSISEPVDVVIDGSDTEYTVSEVEYLIGSVPNNSSFYTYDEIYGDIVVTNTILITRKDGKPINSSIELEAVARMYVYKYKGLESVDKRVSIYEEKKSRLSDYIIDPDTPRI